MLERATAAQTVKIVEFNDQKQWVRPIRRQWAQASCIKKLKPFTLSRAKLMEVKIAVFFLFALIFFFFFGNKNKEGSHFKFFPI